MTPSTRYIKVCVCVCVCRAEELHDEAMKQGHGGSLLKDLRLLQGSQKLKADTTLYAKDSSQLHSIADKLEHWREHFEAVNNVTTQLTYSLTEEVVGIAVEPHPTLQYDD